MELVLSPVFINKNKEYPVIAAVSKLGTLNYEINYCPINGNKFIAYIVNMERL